MSRASAELRARIQNNMDAINAILARYGARNPELFGSVARGDASVGSDIDIMVDLSAGIGNPLLRVSGISEELTELLGVRVEVVAKELLKPHLRESSGQDRIALCADALRSAPSISSRPSAESIAIDQQWQATPAPSPKWP